MKNLKFMMILCLTLANPIKPIEFKKQILPLMAGFYSVNQLWSIYLFKGLDYKKMNKKEQGANTDRVEYDKIAIGMVIARSFFCLNAAILIPSIVYYINKNN